MFRKFITIFGTIFGAFFIIAVGFGGVVLMGNMRPQIKQEKPEVLPPTVFYQIADEGPVTLNVRAQGEVRPRTDINLTAEVAGRVMSTSDNFVNGGAFREGEVLIQIQDADYRVAVTGAKARVAQAEEALRREEAEAALAEKDYKELGIGDDPSDLALRVPQLAQARANYNAAAADLRAAELNLARTRVKAQFDGRVRERIAGPGQYVAPGAALGRIFSTDIAEIRLPLTDADLAKLGIPIDFVATDDRPGPLVQFSTVIAGEMHTWEGHVERTDGAIDPTTRQISAIAVVEDPYGKASDNGAPLAMGLFVDAEITGRPYERAIVMPRRALYGRDVMYVVTADDTLDERTVAVITSDKNTVTIASGIEPGERVVVSPLRGSVAGDKVSPVNPDANQSSSTTIAGATSAGGIQ